jgi:hypothetical protein
VHHVVHVSANDVDGRSFVTPEENPPDDHCLSYRVGSPESARESARRRVRDRSARKLNDHFFASP